jgi:hypothetical protein
MDDKLSLKGYQGLDKPPAGSAAAGAEAAGRRIIAVGPRWAVAINRKLVGAIGLALLVWAFIVALLTLL